MFFFEIIKFSFFLVFFSLFFLFFFLLFSVFFFCFFFSFFLFFFFSFFLFFSKVGPHKVFDVRDGISVDPPLCRGTTHGKYV